MPPIPQPDSPMNEWAQPDEYRVDSIQHHAQLQGVNERGQRKLFRLHAVRRGEKWELRIEEYTAS